MRNLGLIPHPRMAISLFSWNGRYLVKFEQGHCEQTYKFDHLEIDETDLRARLDESFFSRIEEIFKDMQATNSTVLS